MAESARSTVFTALLLLLFATHTHSRPDETPESLRGVDARTADLQAKWGQDWPFSGISTFAHLPHVKCLTRPDETFDIGVVGVPFDSAVSYRPGARFGPRALRAASARQLPQAGWNPRAGMNPYASGLKIIDCEDMPVSPMDNSLALRQMTEAYLELGTHSTPLGAYGQRDGEQGAGEKPAGFANKKPRLVTLGGDHSIALPALRALRKIYQERITVLHFDAHMDTWYPFRYGGPWFDRNVPVEEQQSAFTHGSMFWLAGREGLISGGNTSDSPPNVHAGLRARLAGYSDCEQDEAQGWVRIASDEISADLLGPLGVAKRILETIGTEAPVYLSVDIDVIDPGLAPATGTPEAGGWTTRELIRCIRALAELNIVGADLVEVSPMLEGADEKTAIAGQQIVYEIITSMAMKATGHRDAAKSKEPRESVKYEL